jgi:hypothetical protein
MVAFLRGKGHILWDVTVNTTYVHSINFLAPRSRDMHDANNKVVDYLFRALCQSEFDRVQTEDLASCWECSGARTLVCDLSKRVRELHSSPQ